ncbi:hypothetical protein OCS65_18270 [Rhodococcus aetherivorans]|uniref:Uncharacterized protein n=1 Tax=Rhodococcus aetherivorans TaxID=191292 RepID=A0AA46PSJ3_9NOCA|nr:hypothetical protein [Rhodococcus aetherivorans]UYF92426.1 hypothetical protein OCS65_18270 [Rhodococcus aetherivorans]
MPVDLCSVVTSGVVSALVGGVVSWITARHVTVRQERARTAEQARRKLAVLIAPKLRDIMQFNRGELPTIGRRPDDKSVQGQDREFCAQILKIASDQGWFRRRRVLRLCERVFGSETVELAKEYGTSEGIPIVGIGDQIITTRSPQIPQPGGGLFDRALRKKPGDPLVRKLIRELDRLSRC